MTSTNYPAITPKSFDPITSRTMVGDERARVIEAGARADAERDEFSPPESDPNAGYWNQCQNGFERSVYLAQYKKRRARIERKAPP